MTGVITGIMATVCVGSSLGALAYSRPPYALVALAVVSGLLLARMLYVASERRERRRAWWRGPVG